ncbi:hypothetical protein [Pedobacter aquatilis]|uniref:hypothetical protein n=1 Tax=Pedobacter aquatilis TaxID=351343 RepID=UPI00292FC23E|nr:hypothetical protein [Pedobacter aquatilis]
MTNGDNIIYHYIQKTLLAEDTSDEFAKELIERLIIDLSIWLPTHLYQKIPVLLPYVVRDHSCRTKKPGQLKHEWGNANQSGYLRDDNSLIKGIIKPLFVDSRRIIDYNNKKLANGFVACHIWQKLELTQDKLASRHPATNSFIPNLVWLPRQIAKLTDREGSFAQNLLKTISYKIYGAFTSPLTDNIWPELFNPQIQTKYPVDISRLNYFRVNEAWTKKRREITLDEIEQIKTIHSTNVLGIEIVKCSSYLPTLLTNSDKVSRKDFIAWLDENVKHLSRSPI